jgi:hypothetical protein
MKLFVKNYIPIISIFLSFFLYSGIYADAFKCVDNKGNTIFQDSECGDNKKETKIEITKYAGNSQCTFSCDASRTICVADLGLRERNTGKGLLLCEKAKQACDTRCYNPALGKELEMFTAIERSRYERELRNKQALKDDAQYQEERERRLAQRERKRQQRHCHKYEKKLAKIKARWAQKQRNGWQHRDEEYYRRKIENAEDEVAIECQ